jgi:type IV pilus assembly protein PilC
MLFEYTVLDLKQRRIKGSLEASTFKEARTILKERRYFILKLFKKQNLAESFKFFHKRGKEKLNFNSLVDFTRQMGIMINAGLTLVDSLSIITTQSTDTNQKEVIKKIEDYVKNGESLSTAMGTMPNSFPNYYVSLIKAGESSGKLDDVFLRLAENLEKAREFRGKIVGALIYPVIIVLGIVAVAFVMITFVLPQLLDLYKNFNIDLPVSTQIIIGLSGFFNRYWPLILLGVFLLGMLLQAMIRSPKYRKVVDMYLIRIPVFGQIIQKSILVDTTRTLSILVQSGVPLLEGIKIVRNTTSNEIYKDALTEIYKDIEKGVSLGDALNEVGIFPSIFVQMTSVGERTGKLDDTLMRLSKYFQMESELAIKAATTLIEPLILVLLGLGVGFLVISVLTPIYNLTSSIGST